MGKGKSKAKRAAALAMAVCMISSCLPAMQSGAEEAPAQTAQTTGAEESYANERLETGMGLLFN